MQFLTIFQGNFLFFPRPDHSHDLLDLDAFEHPRINQVWIDYGEVDIVSAHHESLSLHRFMESDGGKFTHAVIGHTGCSKVPGYAGYGHYVAVVVFDHVWEECFQCLNGEQKYN